MARGEFLTQPEVRWVAIGSNALVLRGPLIYRDSKERIWRVEEGFQSDLASVPRALPVLVRFWFRGPLPTAHAAILHDWLYTKGLPLDENHEPSRSEADDLFHEALLVSGETHWGARVMWLGVRAGGWWPWREHRKADGTEPPLPPAAA